VEFKNGLAISYQKIGDIHKQQGDLKKALEYFELDLDISKNLHEEHPNLVEYKNNLAVSYINFGLLIRDHLKNPSTAQGNFRKAYILWEQLVKEAPEVTEYPQNLEWIKEQLESLND